MRENELNATESYRASRDQLLALRGQHDRAVAEFRWPDVGERFNWAVDWFDAIARDNDRPALVIVEEDGSSHGAQLRRDVLAPPTGWRPGWAGGASGRAIPSS